MARYKVSFYIDDLQELAKLPVRGFTVVKCEEKKDLTWSQEQRVRRDEREKLNKGNWSEPINVRAASGGDPYVVVNPAPDAAPPAGYSGLTGSFTISHEGTTRRRKPSETEPGKVILRLFDELTIAHPIDICTALKKAGYAPTSYGAICAGLITEGMLYRSGRGAYRRPTPLEQVQST